ncbi:MAG: integrase family protein [Pseudomonadota bacterium]|nr:integrase family protein [Pseudomonadota bacterium]
MAVTWIESIGFRVPKVKLTAGRIADFKCEVGKSQSFLWDAIEPGLGLRVTSTGSKAYIFQSKLAGKTIRTTIGDPRTWSLESPRDKAGRPTGKGAREEANRLQHIINEGRDPRIVRADGLAAEQGARDHQAAEQAAEDARQVRESVTVGQLWPIYVADRTPDWSDLHLRDHARVIQEGGAARARSKKKTEAGPLAELAAYRLGDLTVERIDKWAKAEAAKRATSARLALRLLRAFLHWCSRHKDYAGICDASITNSKRAKQSLGKSKAKKHDLLQREQLSAWFAEVLKIRNPVVSTYLQVLLLIGARREELAALRFEDIDFTWKSIKLHDKVEEYRLIPLTPYVERLFLTLKRLNETPPTKRVQRRLNAAGIVWEPSPWVFSSPKAASGRLTEPSIAHRKACEAAGIKLSLHGLRRSFATLSLWTLAPGGVAAQIQGHAAQGVREENYIFRSLDLLRMGHEMIENYILEQAGINGAAVPAGLLLVASAA